MKRLQLFYAVLIFLASRVIAFAQTQVHQHEHKVLVHSSNHPELQRFIDQYPIVFALSAPFGFIALWCFLCFLMSMFSGWSALAKRFRSIEPFQGKTFLVGTALMQRKLTYRRALIIGCNQQGLYLHTKFLFRFQHPALFIPWPEISIQKYFSTPIFRYVAFSFGREEAIPFSIPEKLAQQIQAYAGSSWPTSGT